MGRLKYKPILKSLAQHVKPILNRIIDRYNQRPEQSRPRKVKMAMKLRNCQGIRVSECFAQIYAFNNTDILEEILVRVPPEFISTTILVSKCWFGLIRSTSFREHYTRRWRRTLHLVGFKGFYVRDAGFFQTPISQDSRMGIYHWDNAHRFLSTCKEGVDDDNDVDHCRRGGIFGQYDYLIDSTSNGILLIGRQIHPFTFIVWNPFTNKHHQLPQPQENFRCGCMAFEVEYYGKGSFHYKVTRAKADLRGRAIDPIPIQTYSSKTGRWEEKTLPSSPYLKLRPLDTGTVIGGVIHWRLYNGGVGIYDPSLGRNQALAFVSSPDKGTPLPYPSRARRYSGAHCYGESGDGRLQCARKCTTDVKIWVLEIQQRDYSNYKWSLRYKIDVNTLRSKNPSLSQGFHHFEYFLCASFIPRNSEHLFITLEGIIFMLHIPTEKLEHIPYEDEANSSQNWYKFKRDVIPYFKWACPWPELLIATSF